jgi:lysophospholipase L1-like esterase
MMMKILKYYIILLLLIASCFCVKSQIFPIENYEFDFINYENNKLLFYKDSSNFIKLYKLLNNLILKGEGQINIVHIGDSHIQADYFSGHLRYLFQNYFENNGGRGLVFPYKIARTNSPYNYSCNYTGKWTSCRNVQLNKSCELGLTGISVSTSDRSAIVKIIPDGNNFLKYDFIRLKIFFNNDSCNYNIIPESCTESYKVMNNPELGYSEFRFKNYFDTLDLKFERRDSISKALSLYGISLETDDPGIIYHSAGINGAEVSSFLRCRLFYKHLKVLNPQMVIISLGTNDSYSKKFDALSFYNNLENFLSKISEQIPEAAVILTVPSDNYRKRKYKNPNIALARNEIIKIAAKYNCAVWDLYDIMGGYNSIIKWQKSGLTLTDRLHFSIKGYYLQGDLLFDAFLKSYYNFIDCKSFRTLN